MDGKLLAQLYEKYSREILLYVYSLCHSMEIAEDITQEVFAKAILSLPDDHGNFRAWLYMVARNITYNHTRKTLNGQKAFDKLKADKLQVEDIADRVALNDRYRELYRSIEQLSDRYREVLILQYFGGMQLKEIAVVLGVSPGNARILSHRAKNMLKKLMEEAGHEI